MMKKDALEVVPYPLSRIGTVDLGKIALSKHHIAGLLEVDVTDVLAHVKKQRAEGQSLSFFAWMVKIISSAIERDRYMHGILGPRRRTVVFHDIDISVVVERVVQGKRVPLPLVIRKTNGKTAEDIAREIQAAQRQEIRNEGDYVLKENKISRTGMMVYYALPQFVRLFLLRRILRNPYRMKNLMGSVIITSVGTRGRLPGWVIPRTMHNVCFALGSIVRKPWVIQDRVEVRDILHLTVLFDHDVVDGGPAARFISRLAGRIQKMNTFQVEP